MPSAILDASSALMWTIFLLVLGLTFSKDRNLSSVQKYSALTVLAIISCYIQIFILGDYGPDIDWYIKALQVFVGDPLHFYSNYGFSHPPLFLYLAALSYLIGFSATFSMHLVLVLANLASALLLFHILGGNWKGLLGAGLLLYHPFFIRYTLVDFGGEALVVSFLFLAIMLWRRPAAHGMALGASLLAKQSAAYPLIALIVKRIAGDKNAGIRVIAGIVIAFVVGSSVDLVFTPSSYIGLITGIGYYQGLGGGGSAGAYSSFWSVLSWLTSVTRYDFDALQVLRTPLLLILGASLLLFVAVRKDANPILVVLLSYIPYLLGAKFLGGWYITLPIPFIIPVYLLGARKSLTGIFALSMLLSTIPYRIADYYSLFTGLNQPYIYGDIAVAATSFAFFITAIDYRKLFTEVARGFNRNPQH